MLFHFFNIAFYENETLILNIYIKIKTVNPAIRGNISI